MSILFKGNAVPNVKARRVLKKDKEDCLKLLHMVREKYGIDAYLYFRNMLAVVVMKEKYDYQSKWITLSEFNYRNLTKIPYFNDFQMIKDINYAGHGDRQFFGISIDSLEKSFYHTLRESTDYWITNNGYDGDDN